MTPRRPQGRLPVNLHPGRIAIGYIVVGLVWIYGSGFALRLPIFNGFTEALKGNLPLLPARATAGQRHDRLLRSVFV